MPVKITDVARHAGVSMKTVSRVLNSEPNVSDDTREKVQASVTALRYRPNLAARGLAGKRSYLMALVYDNPSADYIANIQRGATAACREKGYHLMVEPLNMAGEDLSSDMEVILERLPVDGVILTPPLSDSARLMTVLGRAQTPYARVGHVMQANEAPIISMDDQRACQQMTQYLISMGHKHIGFIKGHPRHVASQLRFEGYSQAMKAAGLSLNPASVKEGDFSFASGAQCALEILSQERPPSAIFASNDDMAAAVMSTAGQMGLSIPDDLSVCGFDDTALSRVLWPTLTTIKQPIYEMGYAAAKAIITRCGKEGHTSAKAIHLDYALVERASVKDISK